LDRVLNHGDQLVPKKRNYDNDKLESLFPDGLVVYNRLLQDARSTFIRFIAVDSKQIPSLIDCAAGYQVDRTAQPYDTAYSKVMQWRKNWFSLYLEVADQKIQDFVKVNAYLKALSTEKPYADLKSAYARLYGWAHVQDLFRGIDVGTFLWKDTLDKPKLKALYKTIFTYTMM
jgi:hypothetical protein